MKTRNSVRKFFRRDDNKLYTNSGKEVSVQLEELKKRQTVNCHEYKTLELVVKGQPHSSYEILRDVNPEFCNAHKGKEISLYNKRIGIYMKGLLKSNSENYDFVIGDKTFLIFERESSEVGSKFKPSNWAFKINHEAEIIAETTSTKVMKKNDRLEKEVIKTIKHSESKPETPHNRKSN